LDSVVAGPSGISRVLLVRERELWLGVEAR